MLKLGKYINQSKLINKHKLSQTFRILSAYIPNLCPLYWRSNSLSQSGDFPCVDIIIVMRDWDEVVSR